MKKWLLTGTMVAGIALIAAGVLCVELGSQAAQARELDARAAQARRSA